MGFTLSSLSFPALLCCYVCSGFSSPFTAPPLPLRREGECCREKKKKKRENVYEKNSF